MIYALQHTVSALSVSIDLPSLFVSSFDWKDGLYLFEEHGYKSYELIRKSMHILVVLYDIYMNSFVTIFFLPVEEHL